MTSAWRRSMSSTRKTPEHPGSAKNLPGIEAAEAAEAAEAGEAGEAAEAAEAAEAGDGGAAEGADAPARREHFPITLTQVVSYHARSRIATLS